MVLLSPIELDTTMRMILQVPIWAQRVIYIQGSCLKDADLARARMNEAEACFVLAARNYCDKTAAVSVLIPALIVIATNQVVGADSSSSRMNNYNNWMSCCCCCCCSQ